MKKQNPSTQQQRSINYSLSTHVNRKSFGYMGPYKQRLIQIFHRSSVASTTDHSTRDIFYIKDSQSFYFKACRLGKYPYLRVLDDQEMVVDDQKMNHGRPHDDQIFPNDINIV